jgi:hypothetical protein
MNRNVKLISLAATSILLAACEGDDGLAGSNGSDGVDGLNSLVATRDIPLGDAVCLGGGLALDSGLDTNRNDVLDPAEVTATELLECEATPQVRALHASPDAPPVNIWVNGATALTDVDYGVGSGFLPGLEDVNVQVEAIIPSGNAVVVDEDYSLDYNMEYTIIAVDTVAGIDDLVIANPSDQLLTPGSFFAQVVHASPSAPPVNVFVTAFGADLTASAPVNMAPLAFEDFTPRLEVPEGDYQIRVADATDVSTIYYDSGEISLAAGADLLIAAIENVGLGDSAVQLVALDGVGAATLYDTNTPAAALAVHLSPDAPAVDILADDDATPNDDAIRLATNIAFTEACVIDGIPAPADYTLNVVANADNSIVALQIPFAASVDGAATAIVSGFLSSGTPAITALPLAVDPRSVITESRLRLTHASPSTGDVDIYLLADGTDLDDMSVMPSFAAVPFGADTGVLSIAPATYDVYVTPAGDKSVRAIEVQDVALTGGEVWDIIARDPATDGSEGTLPLPLIVDYDTAVDCT